MTHRRRRDARLVFAFACAAMLALPGNAAEARMLVSVENRAQAARACLVAASEAEARLGLPRGLLAAVSVVESAAHPFAIGAPDAAHYPATKAAALRLAEAAPPGAAGGCFQINLSVHAREDAAWVFQPWPSALFAGRKLARLAGETGADWGPDWGAALARYAGAAPGSAAGEQHRCRVAGSFSGLGLALPEGLSAEGCEARVLRAAATKARTIARTAAGPEAVAALP